MNIKVRNFSIIAHIDHGKSTLADRLLEKTKSINVRQMKAQVLDDMDLERERGITIKSHPISVKYNYKDGNEYKLNFIDTPGHVDFSYEVSRSLAACEGALLLVDAAQGVEAQTVSNAYLAIENDLTIIPVINKIDLPTARIESVKNQIMDLIGCEEDEIIYTSAKTGKGLDELLEAIVERIPAPVSKPDLPLRALIFDSTYDSYRGAIAYIRVFDGKITHGDIVRMFANNSKHEATEVGIFKLEKFKTKELVSGDVGYLVCGIKTISDIEIGDTVTLEKNPAEERLEGYKPMKPMVYSGMYPVEAADYVELRGALEKMQLNDSSLSWEPETSTALGFGFRMGYLGLLHMEVIQERLEREFNLDLITTLPNVKFEVLLKTGKKIVVEKPSDVPPIGDIDTIYEPYIKAEILTPPDFQGNIMKLVMARRGVYVNTHFLDVNKVQLNFELPLLEVIYDFYDKLKSSTKGYASFDYDHIGYKEGKLVKLDVLINGENVDALSMIVHNDNSYYRGRDLCVQLKKLIPRQMFEIAIQAAIGSKVIARTNVKALRKNVTAKCYGGDISRKRKLLEKQKKGKKRMKSVGNVDIPQEAFLAVLSMDSDAPKK